LKITKKNAIFVFIGIFVVASYFLPFFVTFFIAIGQGGRGGFIEIMKDVDFALVVFANWPTFLFKSFPTKRIDDGREVIAPGIALDSPKVYGINAIGWGLIGLVVGALVSVAKAKKERKNRRSNSDKKK
jgi:hypothetical protein